MVKLMARPRAFEPTEALDAATVLFWEKGFSATSYDDLVAATKVSRKSLYSVFGDKESLFLQALQHYRKTKVPGLFAALYEDNVSVDRIVNMLEGLAKAAASGKAQRGCLLANTAGDAVILKPDVRRVFNDHMKQLSADFAAALRRAGRRADDCDRLGHYLAGAVQSLLLMAHAQSDAKTIGNFMAVATGPLKEP